MNMGVKKQSREPLSLEEFLSLSMGSSCFYVWGRSAGFYSYDLSDGKLTLSYEPDPKSTRGPATYTFTLDGLPPFRSEDSMLTAATDFVICREEMREVKREPEGADRWCFHCRTHRAFEYVVSAPVGDSYYGLSMWVECGTCRTTDGDLFPGRCRDWEES